MDGKKHRVYCLMSDGEQEEGNTWEAALFAGKNKLNNLTAVMDRNNIQIDGNTENVMPLEPLADKYRAFNWHVLEVNGHDLSAFVSAVEEAKTIYEKPTLIIAHTISGKGVPEIEGDYHWHGEPPTAVEGKRFLEQIRTRGFTLIELLVVIAIIGILSAVVLASLSTARSRGNDSAVKQNFHGIQVQAELYSIGNGDYGTLAYGTACNAGMFTDAVIARAKASVDSLNGSGKVYCYANSSEYLIAAELSSGYWCIDSTGAAKEETGAAPTSIPAGNVCP
jgi:prepilin-type N-terminal cleavage/methylation domain-containing protein